MAQPPTSEPGPSKADASATEVLREQLRGNGYETDLAQLAAVFSAHGGGVSSELSKDLALDIVLNEIVVQACLSTGATGAAIALERDGEMVCRASNGATAPALGSRLDATSGLSGECLRTRQIQRTDDVLADARVDRDAWQSLGVRCVMVMPLIRREKFVGLFELFSTQPQAFGERDERTLEALAARIVSSLERAALPLPALARAPVLAQSEPVEDRVEPPVREAVPVSGDNHVAAEGNAHAMVPGSATGDFADSITAAAPRSPAEDWGSADWVQHDSSDPGVDVITWALRAAVVVCAVLLGLLLGRHLPSNKTLVHSNPPAAAETNVPPAESNVPPEKQEAAEAASQPVAPVKSKEKDVPAGGLRIFENGKEIFHLPPPQAGATQDPAGSVERASSAEPDTSISPLPAVAEGTLLYRVEPEYPEEARRKGIEGAVVLAVHIGGDGAVQSVQLVSGSPELAPPSIAAVKQWRFQPRSVNGRVAPMQTTITLNYKLPQ